MEKLVYKRNGKPVTRREFMRKARGVAAGAPMLPPSKGWPMISDAAGVHESQVAEAESHARAMGVPTEFVKGGEMAGAAIFRDRVHRKAFLKAHRMHDNDGGYGD